MKKVLSRLSILAVAVLVTGCGSSDNLTTPTPTPTASSSPSTSPNTLSSPADVEIRDYTYSPTTLEVKKGTTISFTNFDSVGHTVTAKDDSFDTPSFSNGGTQSITFDKAGTFEYYCKPHTYMKGKIIVIE